MKQLHELKAAVVGTGFIGAVHADALRRLGIEILGVAGSTPERGRADVESRWVNVQTMEVPA